MRGRLAAQAVGVLQRPLSEGASVDTYVTATNNHLQRQRAQGPLTSMIKRVVRDNAVYDAIVSDGPAWREKAFNVMGVATKGGRCDRRTNKPLITA